MAERAREPAVRAGSVQDVLAFLDAYDPGAQARVRALVPDDVLQAIDETPRMGWIHVEDDVHVPTAIWELFGDEEATRVLRLFLLRHFKGSILGPLVRKTSRLFGLTPISIVRMLPAGWNLVYRDCARLEVRALEEGRAEVVFHDVAPPVIASAAYLASFRAILLGLLEVTNHTGEAVLAEVDRDARRAVYALRWEPVNAARAASATLCCLP